MRILLLCHAFNSLSQRLYAELAWAGHEISVELDISDAVTIDAVDRFMPDVVLAPFLKRRIPDAVWKSCCCLIVHPGPPGNRGPDALDWAILDQQQRWAVTVLQATGELDGGPVWASSGFPMRTTRKSSLYRREVSEAAVTAVFCALARIEAGAKPEPAPSGRWRDGPGAEARRIDWQHDNTSTVLRKIYSADGQPGVVDDLAGVRCRLFNVWPEAELRGRPGELIARMGEAVCRATSDGAVWIGHLRADRPGAFKIPAAQLLARRADDLPALAPDFLRTGRGPVVYREYGLVGWLEFDFYNGAMGRADCHYLLEAWRYACRRPTRVIVLAGGSDFWSNGMDLNSIEAAASPAEASWENIHAIDDLAEAVICTTSHLCVSALSAAAAAGGVFLALAADRVVARTGVVLNPHYRNMGNLYGSEYWTYLLPRRLSGDQIEDLMSRRLPMLASEALRLGLIDEVGPAAPDAFRDHVAAVAQNLAGGSWTDAIERKRQRRVRDESLRPLADYREQELDRMRQNFFGFDPSYHVARHRLVHRTPHAWTPLHLAAHRRLGWVGPDRARKAGKPE